MHCIRKVSDDIIWIGADDRRLAMFEGVYPSPRGVSYNSYVILDGKIAVFDTVDKAVARQYFENLDCVLAGRKPDYLIIQHMEPDHSAEILRFLEKYPSAEVVCNALTARMMVQFFTYDVSGRARIVADGDKLSLGTHELEFLAAPMVHWPEVMTTVDITTGTLFSADAFGTFGALNGALFADEVDFDRDYLDEARRYYANIVGKYGDQTEALLNKASAYDLQIIAPLHGFVWRKNLTYILEKYTKWSRCVPEDDGVMIAYASVYGGTENAANILAVKLNERGIRTEMFDVSVAESSEIVAAVFRWSKLVFASTTYNMGIFIRMEETLRDIAAHSPKNRRVALIENGSWAPQSGKLMREILSQLSDFEFVRDTLSLRSTLTEAQLNELDAMVDALV